MIKKKFIVAVGVVYLIWAYLTPFGLTTGFIAIVLGFTVLEPFIRNKILPQINKYSLLIRYTIVCDIIFWGFRYALFRYAESGGNLWIIFKEVPQRTVPFILPLFLPWKGQLFFDKHKMLLNLFLLISTIATVLVFYGGITVHWRISAIIEWAVLGFSLLWLYDWKTKNWFFSLFMGFESVIAGGIYYELPTLLHRQDYSLCGSRFPLIVATSLLALPLLLYGFKYVKFKTKKYLVPTLIFYVCFSLFWALTKCRMPYELMRIPMMAVLISIPLSLKSSSQNHNQ